MRASFELITYYMARRLLGALARTIDRYDQRERERLDRLRAHHEGTRADR